MYMYRPKKKERATRKKKHGADFRNTGILWRFRNPHRIPQVALLNVPVHMQWTLTINTKTQHPYNIIPTKNNLLVSKLKISLYLLISLPEQNKPRHNNTTQLGRGRGVCYNESAPHIYMYMYIHLKINQNIKGDLHVTFSFKKKGCLDNENISFIISEQD